MISTIAFENLDFEKQIEQLTKDNTDKQYEGYLQRLGDNTNLYLEDVRKT